MIEVTIAQGDAKSLQKRCKKKKNSWQNSLTRKIRVARVAQERKEFANEFERIASEEKYLQ